jgi:hypothetical protein
MHNRWSKLLNVELHNLPSLPSDEMDGDVAGMGEVHENHFIWKI